LEAKTGRDNCGGPRRSRNELVQHTRWRESGRSVLLRPDQETWSGGHNMGREGGEKRADNGPTSNGGGPNGGG